MNLKAIITNLSLTFGSIYIPLLVFSTYSYISEGNARLRIENKRIKDEDESMKLAAIESGFKPIIFPDNFLNKKSNIDIYPIGSMPNTKKYFCNEGYGLITYKSDRFGLRNPDKNWRKALNQSNIFLIGDSFTQGSCVPESATIRDNIERIKNKNTLNLGMGGNGPYEYSVILKTLINPIIKKSQKHHTVVVIFYSNDNVSFQEREEKLLKSSKSIVNFSSEKGVFPSDYYLKKKMDFITNNFPQSKDDLISGIKKQTTFRTSAFYYISSLSPIRKRLGITTSREKLNLIGNLSSKKSISERSILRLYEICKDSCKPIIAYIPSSNFWHPDPRSNTYKNTLLKLSNKLGIKFIDGEDVINRDDREDYAPKGGHLSISGYKKIANLISSGI